MSWDGKMYDKYRITHTDGTPLKGKKYFVLRLDSDDPVEAARVAAAMRAYKSEPRNCDVYLTEEAVDAATVTVRDCAACSRIDMEAPCVSCMVRWLLAPAAVRRCEVNEKPPLGIVPRYIHDERRAREIIDAVLRYLDAAKPVPREWLEELFDRVKIKEEGAAE